MSKTNNLKQSTPSIRTGLYRAVLNTYGRHVTYQSYAESELAAGVQRRLLVARLHREHVYLTGLTACHQVLTVFGEQYLPDVHCVAMVVVVW